MQLMEAPSCPQNYSVPKWANLLFGGSHCQVARVFLSLTDNRFTQLLLCQSCGVRGVSRIDFGLRRRICGDCAKEKCVSSI